MNNVEIREVYGQAAVDLLSPLLRARKWRIPPPGLLMAKVAFDGEDVVGFVLYQLIPHTEPLWVAPKYRGTGLAAELADEAVKFADAVGAGYMCLSSSPAVVEIAKEHKMREITHVRVWQGGNLNMGEPK